MSARKFDALDFVREMQILLEAGLNSIEAVRALRNERASRRGNQEATRIAHDLCGRLEEGWKLSDSLKATTAFSPLLCASVGAVETSGNLPDALNRYTHYVERIKKLRQQIAAALTYPIIVAGVGLMVVAFLMLYLIPKFAVIYDDMNAQLPLASRMLFATGVWLQSHMAMAIAVVALIGALAVHFLSDVNRRKRFIIRLSSIKPIEQALMPMELARLYGTLAMLIQSGVPVVTALDMTMPVTAPVVQQRLQAAVQMLRDGHSVVQAFQTHQLATPAAVGLLQAADRAGSLGDVFQAIATFYDDLVERQFGQFLRFFEPAILIVVAVCIGAVVIMMYMPIFEMVGQVG